MKIIWRLAPFLCIFLGVVLGGFVLVWAKNIGIFSYVVPPDVPLWLPGKEVGFAAAWNWTFSLLLMPVMVALVIWIIQSTRQALMNMHGLGMIVDDGFNPVPKPMLERIWRALVIAIAVLAVVITALFVWFTLDQYDDVIGQHFAAESFQELAKTVLIEGKGRYHPPTELHEFDWSVAALIDQASAGTVKRISVESNKLFSFFVYIVYLGLFASAFFIVVAWMFVAIAAASLTLFDNPGVRIVPSLTSRDPRRGFESLEATFIFILIAIFLAYFAAYLVVTQNLYLRTTHEGWGELFFGAVVEALDKASGQDSAEVWPMLLLVAGFIAEDRTGGAITNSVDAVFAAMAGALVLIVSSGAVILMLRRIALHGRAQLARHRSETLPDIKVWPIEWPSVTDFLIAIFLASVALFLFRLGAILFLGALMLALYRLWRVSRAKLQLAMTSFRMGGRSINKRARSSVPTLNS